LCATSFAFRFATCAASRALSLASCACMEVAQHKTPVNEQLCSSSMKQLLTQQPKQ
jgi:hypothetical protein